MGIVTRSFVFRNRIKVSKEDLLLAELGRKTCTIRLGKVGVAQELCLLSDGKRQLRVRITGIDNSRVYGQLTDSDAVCEGFLSKAELAEDLRKYYGRISDEQPVTVIHFEVIPAST